MSLAPKKQYNEDDAAEETDTTTSDVKKTWHQAREDCQNSDDNYDKKLSKGWKRKSDKEEEAATT